MGQLPRPQPPLLVARVQQQQQQRVLPLERVLGQLAQGEDSRWQLIGQGASGKSLRFESGEKDDWVVKVRGFGCGLELVWGLREGIEGGD